MLDFWLPKIYIYESRTLDSDKKRLKRNLYKVDLNSVNEV